MGIGYESRRPGPRVACAVLTSRKPPPRVAEHPLSDARLRSAAAPSLNSIPPPLLACAASEQVRIASVTLTDESEA